MHAPGADPFQLPGKASRAGRRESQENSAQLALPVKHLEAAGEAGEILVAISAPVRAKRSETEKFINSLKAVAIDAGTSAARAANARHNVLFVSQWWHYEERFWA